MFLREHPYVAVLCLTAILSCCVALTAWTRREIAPATRPFTALMVAIALYATTAAISAATFSLKPSIFWATLQYIASNSVIAFYLTFTLHFSGRRQWSQHWRRRLLIWALPVFNMGLVITNHWHRMVWSEFVLPTAPGELVTFRHGSVYFWIVACFYIYVVTGTLLIARVALNASSLYQRQATSIMLSASPPIIAGSLYALALVPHTVNILPMSFLFTGLIYFASLFYFRLFDLLPIARDVLIERMTDGVLVLDNRGRVIDINAQAQRYTHAAGPLIGKPVSRVLSDWPDIVSHCHSEDALTTVLIVRAHIPCYLEVKVTRLRNQQRGTGRLLIIRDITQQHQNRLHIEQANSELKSQLKEIEALRDQLKEQSIRDRLTGLFNRRYFEETLPAELTKAKRSGSSLSIMLLDIDHFKKVNDTYGHLAGDEALRRFAQIMQQHIRTSDIACRYGGEEFVIALPQMTLAEACDRANNIRETFKATALTFNGQLFYATVSIGIGTFPDITGTQSQLLQQVDQALYTAKANGRDRIETVPSQSQPLGKRAQLENAIREYQRQL
ncbi:MAG: diguanylate cyclase [Cyanobacteria bacterium J06598_3]